MPTLGIIPIVMLHPLHQLLVQYPKFAIFMEKVMLNNEFVFSSTFMIAIAREIQQ